MFAAVTAKRVLIVTINRKESPPDLPLEGNAVVNSQSLTTGITLGVVIGVAIGLAIDNIGAGIGIGLAIGIAFAAIRR